MTARNSKSVAKCSAFAIAMLVTSSGTHALPLVNWVWFIHCHGTDTNHSEPSAPDHEVFTRDGDAFNQCHGTSGEIGQCNVSQNGLFWKVTCDVVTVLSKTTSRCVAQATCASGDTLYCVGTNGQAFAGLAESDNQLQQDTLFVLCRGSNGAITDSEACHF